MIKRNFDSLDTVETVKLSIIFVNRQLVIDSFLIANCFGCDFLFVENGFFGFFKGKA